MMTAVGYEWRCFFIPDQMGAALDRYIATGCPTGGFLFAVLCNDLMAACGRADNTNALNLPAYAAFLCNEAPSQCFGSPEKVTTWIQQHNARRIPGHEVPF